MSSPPAEAPPGRRRAPWEPWRKVMMVGALWLWSFYVIIAIGEIHPSQWVLFPVNFIGYGLLSVGFVLRMRQRREAKDRASRSKAPETGTPTPETPPAGE